MESTRHFKVSGECNGPNAALPTLGANESGPFGELIIRCFLRSAMVIFGLTGAIKLLSVMIGPAKLMGAPEGLFPYVSLGQIYLFAGLLELSVFWTLTRMHNPTYKLMLVAWLSSAFVAYRLLRLWAGAAGPCACLGNASEWLNLKPPTMEFYLKIVLGHLAFSSYLLLFTQLKGLIVLQRYTKRLFTALLPLAIIAQGAIAPAISN